jgi:hypothetical protein
MVRDEYGEDEYHLPVHQQHPARLQPKEHHHRGSQHTQRALGVIVCREVERLRRAPFVGTV